jgi:hypothetical protein
MDADHPALPTGEEEATLQKQQPEKKRAIGGRRTR